MFPPLLLYLRQEHGLPEGQVGFTLLLGRLIGDPPLPESLPDAAGVAGFLRVKKQSSTSFYT